MAQNPRWLPIMATNYSYKNCSIDILNFSETTNTAISIQKTQFVILDWVFIKKSLQWRQNERDGLSNHQPHDCLLDRLFRHRAKMCL